MVHVGSFSYHYQGGPPQDEVRRGGFVFDCRCLPNPGRVTEYKSLTGLDPEVVAYLEGEPSVAQFLAAIADVVRVAVASERPVVEHLTVLFGCTGGQHRSVYCAEWLAKHLDGLGIPNEVTHGRVSKAESGSGPVTNVASVTL